MDTTSIPDEVMVFQILIEGHIQQVVCQESQLEFMAHDFRRRLDAEGKLASSKKPGLRPGISAQIQFPDGREKSLALKHYYTSPAGYVRPAVEPINQEGDWQRLYERGLQFEP